MPKEQSTPGATESPSVAALFEETAKRVPEKPFVAFRHGETGALEEVDYRDFAARITAARQKYAAAGYGVGSRAAILTGNRPEFYVHYLALNGLGVSIVPLSPDARPAEMLYLIEHSQAAFAVVSPDLHAVLEQAIGSSQSTLPVFDALSLPENLPTVTSKTARQAPEIEDEAAVLYTSGTTGRPKGCLLSNRYFIEAGRFYSSWGGRLSLREGCERLLNPLPLFHMNNLVVTTTAMIAKGGCNVMVERFSPTRWWRDCSQSRATLIHYLGVMPALLLARPSDEFEQKNLIRAGVGAGVDPKHHSAFEQRFGFPLLELWGMTEVGCGFIDNFEPRQVGTRAFGRPAGTMRAKIVDDAMQEVATGTPGELLVQTEGDNPRRALFSGYLKDTESTRKAWHGDWFRTGDVVRQDESGMLYFVDRKKNIVRRSGENIAAAEVEACLQSHADVLQAAVIAVPDDIREEEVFACIVVKEGVARDSAVANALFAWALEHLSYFKAPGYVCFREALPTTGTQKIQKGLIFEDGEDPPSLETTFDLRARKRQTSGRQVRPDAQIEATS